jgi:hypothetical protein
VLAWHDTASLLCQLVSCRTVSWWAVHLDIYSLPMELCHVVA